jgi:hypothetical protein
MIENKECTADIERQVREILGISCTHEVQEVASENEVVEIAENEV